MKLLDTDRPNPPKVKELMEMINQIIIETGIVEEEEEKTFIYDSKKLAKDNETPQVGPKYISVEQKTLEELKEEAKELGIKNLHVYTEKNKDKLEAKILEANKQDEQD